MRQGSRSNFIIILNDNNMSISENVGGLSSYLAGFRTADAYLDLKLNVLNSLNKMPYGDKMVSKIRKTKSGIKQLLIPGMFFEEMGIVYLGPVDGHNLHGIVKLLREASHIDGPVLIHVMTHKGARGMHRQRDILQDSTEQNRLILKQGFRRIQE